MQKTGFTLIELLVVVLIIGILSAIALPQYTKAVEKARMTEAMTLLSSWRPLVEEYILSTGCNAGDEFGDCFVSWDCSDYYNVGPAVAGITVPKNKSYMEYDIRCQGNNIYMTARNNKTGVDLSLNRYGKRWSATCSDFDGYAHPLCSVWKGSDWVPSEFVGS